MMKKYLGTVALLCMFVFVFGTTTTFALATATATAAAGNNCGKIKIPSGRNDPGILTVSKVFINGVETTNFTVVAGTDNSTRPKIKFDPALNAGDIVKVEMRTKNAGTFTVDLTLETKARNC